MGPDFLLGDAPQMGQLAIAEAEPLPPSPLPTGHPRETNGGQYKCPPPYRRSKLVILFASFCRRQKPKADY